jgi:multiple sugar transport system permease protein
MTGTKRRGIRESQIGLLLALPGMIVFCIIILYPLINAFFMSFTDRSLIRPRVNFVGIENYIQLFKDSNFPGLVKNTIVFVFFSTTLSFTLGFIWAIVLNTKFRLAELFRSITLVNWIFPGVAIGYLWIWIFHGEYGVVNGLL